MALHEKEIQQLETRKNFVIEKHAIRLEQITKQLQDSEKTRVDLEKQCDELKQKLQQSLKYRIEQTAEMVPG